MAEQSIVVTDKTPQSELRALVGNPAVRLDVTNLGNLDRLGPKVKAHIYTDATFVDAQLLIEAGKITANKARNFLAINLEHTDGIEAKSAENVSLMRLRENKAPLTFPAAKQIDFAELRFNTGALTINDNTKIIAPNYADKPQFHRPLIVVNSGAVAPVRRTAAGARPGEAAVPA